MLSISSRPQCVQGLIKVRRFVSREPNELFIMAFTHWIVMPIRPLTEWITIYLIVEEDYKA